MLPKMTLLAGTFARALESVPGQSAAFFPEGLGLQFLLDLAERLNSKDSSFGARAVVMHESDLNLGSSTTVSERELLRYRLFDEGQRIVLASRPFRFESNINVFKPAMFEGFPSGSDGLISLSDIASAAIDELRLGGNSTELSWAMNDVLNVLAELYASNSRAFSDSWTVFWFRHVAQGLENTSVWLKQSERITKSPTEVLHALFGLPSRTESDHTKDIGNSYKDAVTDWWSSSKVAKISSEFIDVRRRERHQSSDLSGFDFDGVSEQKSLVSEGTIFFYKWLSASASNATIFQITEQEFLKPRYLGKKAGLRLFCDGSSLSIRRKGKEEKGPYFIPLSDSEDGVLSCRVEARVTLNREVHSGDLTGVEVEITPRNSELDWKPESIKIQGQDLSITGTLVAKGTESSLGLDESTLDSDLDMNIVAAGALIDAFPNRLSCQIVILVDKPNQVVYFDASKPRPKDYLLDSVSARETVVNDFDSLSILTSATNAQLDAKNMNSTGVGNWSTYTVSSAQHLELSSDDGSLTFIRESAGSNHKSPLIAAAFGEELGLAEPTDRNKSSARGLFEAYLSQNAGDESLLGANFHFLVGEDSKFPDGASASYLPGFITDQMTYQVFQSQQDMAVDPKFLESPEVEGFRQSYRDLEIPSKLSQRSGYDPDWPSRVSWRDLFRLTKSSLDAYLRNYKQMVDLARRDYGQKEVFWATYPFSFSVWDLNAERVECKAVLLSPLHPLRLSWLASVEATLWDASSASKFLGTVEGWNLPYFGPSNVEGAPPLVAIPTDNGEGQLFLGWSMLVSLGETNWTTAKSPPKIVRRAGLGSSSTGFNASTASSALASFRKLFPHLPSIVIDLSALFKNPRLEEVDTAVLKTMESWSNEQNFYPGGIHVLDSSSRLESPPFDALAELIDKKPLARITWKRYAPDRNKKTHSNLRLLQDPGILMRVSEGGEESGAIDSVPIKRFLTHHAIEEKGATSSISPTIEAGSGWLEFTYALSACENSQTFPKLLAQLNRPQIADGTADWSITGDGMVSPSVISKLLGNSEATAGKQMLWEWRPPLAMGLSSEVNQRPFMTVARVPAALPAQIKSMLERADVTDAEERAKDVMTVLGSRGVGLASLLASGGTHGYGAIGFYVAFKVIERLKFPNQEVFALPIDALNVYLERLGQDDPRSSIDKKQKKRADILLIRLRKGTITLSPIEIKLYGLKKEDQETVRLPDFNDSQLDEAKSQAAATTKLLKSIETRAAECRADPYSADSILWRNAFANLVEAAGKLSGANHGVDLVKDSILSMMKNEIDVVAEPGLVLYLHRKAKSRSGNSFEFFDSRRLGGEKTEVSVLTADLLSSFEMMEEPNSPIITKLEDYFDNENAVRILTAPESDPRTSDQPEQIAEIEIIESPAAPVTKTSIEDLPTTDGVRFTIGQSTHSDENVDFWPSNTELTHLNI